MNKIAPIMEFDFQPIKLDEVIRLIPVTYRSKYHFIRQQVIDKIKSMPGDETFIFAPKKDSKAEKLTDNLIARICHGINVGIISEGLNWKITYSTKAKAFVVAPFKRYKLKSRGSTSASIPDVLPEDISRKIDALLKMTQKQFGTTLKDLQTKNPGAHDHEVTKVKKAFLWVANHSLDVSPKYLAHFLGLSLPTTYSYLKMNKQTPEVQGHIGILTKAVNGGSSK